MGLSRSKRAAMYGRVLRGNPQLDTTESARDMVNFASIRCEAHLKL